MNFTELSAVDIRKKLLNLEFTATDVTKAFLERIEKYDSALCSFITVDSYGALKKAGEIDDRISRGMTKKLGSLLGVPVAVKDLICTKNLKTTAGSKMLENFVPTYDATVVQKLRDADAVIIGKTNMDEFAMGSSSETSAFGSVKNPWDTQRTPGGSSGGSAVAVSARLCVAALGTDTGGSIRQPASLCGMVGLKPTYGRVSRYGVIAFASSFDQVGPMTHTVEDSALLLKTIAGRDIYDLTCMGKEVPDYFEGLKKTIRGRILGIPKEYITDDLDEEVKNNFTASVKILEELGVRIVDVSLPHTEFGIPAYYLVATAEASSNLARYDGVRYGKRAKEYDDLIGMYEQSRSKGFGAEVKRRIMLGTFALGSGYYDDYYKKALQIRRLIKNDFDKVFTEVDAVISPASPFPAFKLGEKSTDPLKMYLCDALTVTANLAGIPGISVPSGFTQSGLPLGLQFLGNYFNEFELLRLAYNFEQAVPSARRIPKLG